MSDSEQIIQTGHGIVEREHCVEKMLSKKMQKLEKTLTPEEWLIAQSILQIKKLYCITAEVSSVRNSFILAQDYELYELLGGAVTCLGINAHEHLRIIEKCAEKIGISKTRFNQLKRKIFCCKSVMYVVA